MRNLHICCQGDRIYRLIFRSIDAAAKQVNDMNEAEDFVHDGVAVTIGNLVDVGDWWKLLLSLGLRLVVRSVTEHMGTRTVYSSLSVSRDSLDVSS